MSDSRANTPDRVQRAPRRGFSTAPLVLGGGLILAYQLLTRLVPMLWAEILPGGYDQAAFLPGGARLVRSLGYFCYYRFPIVLAGAIGLVVLGAILGARPATRPLVWCLAVATIVLDAGILFVALKAGMDAAGLGNVLG